MKGGGKEGGREGGKEGRKGGRKGRDEKKEGRKEGEMKGRREATGQRNQQGRASPIQALAQVSEVSVWASLSLSFPIYKIGLW
jgi:hypothetical protein